MKLFYVLLLSFFCVNFVFSNKIKEKKTKTRINLFHIERNKNKNQVHYAITLNGNCRPNSNQPIYVYWLTLEAEKPVTSKIRWYEQRAYGIKEQKQKDPNQFAMILYAFPQKDIYVTFSFDKKKRRCKAVASTKILHREALLHRIYVFAKEKFLIPSVEYVDVFGRLPDGSPIKERLSP